VDAWEAGRGLRRLHPIDQQHTKDLTNTHIRRTPFSAVLARGTNPQQPDSVPPELQLNDCKPLYNKDFDAASTFTQKFCPGGDVCVKIFWRSGGSGRRSLRSLPRVRP
jgi:hypothetical protein